jgi:hypothetical protein
MPTTDERAARREWDEMSFEDQPGEADQTRADDAAELMHATGGMTDSEFNLLGRLITAIRHLVLGVSIVIWTIVGFIFWIPMLVFSIIHFSALIVYATLTEADPSNLASKLERSVTFYLDGFKNIIQAVYRTDGNHSPTSHLRIDAMTLTKHVLSTVGFWLAIVLVTLLTTGVVQSWFSSSEIGQ